jgi:hypothetical protein
MFLHFPLNKSWKWHISSTYETKNTFKRERGKHGNFLYIWSLDTDFCYVYCMFVISIHFDWHLYTNVLTHYFLSIQTFDNCPLSTNFFLGSSFSLSLSIQVEKTGQLLSLLLLIPNAIMVQEECRCMVQAATCTRQAPPHDECVTQAEGASLPTVCAQLSIYGPTAAMVSSTCKCTCGRLTHAPTFLYRNCIRNE